MKDDHQVCMKNELIRAAHGLTLMEKRLLMLAVSKLDSSKPATPQNMVVSLKVSEFVDQYGITAKSTYGDVKSAAEHLMDRYLRFFSPDGKKETRMQWIGRATYLEEQGLVELAFWHELSPMLFELKNHFTSYKLSRAGALRSVYSWRLFELLMQFKRTGFLKIDLDHFNKITDVAPSYRKDFGLIRSKVIDPAIKEIREKDGLAVTWEASKTGRKVTALTFKFPIEQQTELPLDAETASKPPKRRAKAQATKTTDPDQQDALSRYNGLKSMAELSGDSLQSLASEQEWGVFQGMGWVG